MQHVDWLLTVMIAIVSAVIGAFFAGYFSWRYYVWSSKDWKEETENLKQRFEELSQDVRQEVLRSQEQLRNIDNHTVYLIRLLADAGQIEPRRDDKGNVLIPVGSTRSAFYAVKDYETEEREREERERLAREERARELSRRPFRGPLRRIWHKKGEPETPGEQRPWWRRVFGG